MTDPAPAPHQAPGATPSGSRGAPRRRTVLRVVAAGVGLAATATIWSAVARAEQDRTARQIATVHDLLLRGGHTEYEQRPGPETWLSFARPPTGRWGMFGTSRPADDLLRDLRTAAHAASLDEPFCVTPEQTVREDGTVAVRIRKGNYACDLTRGDKPFGSVELSPYETFDYTVVTFGIGPDAEIRHLREQLEHEGDEPWRKEAAEDVSAVDVLRASLRTDVLLAFVVACGSSAAAAGAVVLARRRRETR